MSLVVYLWVTVQDGFSLVPRPSYHGVPVRGPGNSGLRMRLIKTARYAYIVVYDKILQRRQYSIALAILPQRPLMY